MPDLCWVGKQRQMQMQMQGCRALLCHHLCSRTRQHHYCLWPQFSVYSALEGKTIAAWPFFLSSPPLCVTANMATSEIHYLDLQNDYWQDRSAPGMVVKACHPSDWKAEEGRLCIQNQPECRSEILSQKVSKQRPEILSYIVSFPTAHRTMICKLDIVNTISRKIQNWCSRDLF